ncbi:DUF1127 domain-containing protein [Pseudomonas sp. NPDC007930]|uniref:DUF1127 domain-containing protein n=1 Tax=Pseudomonas sp. NPDC007930 TaxID=3364417 RepID=UPI0036F09384
MAQVGELHARLHNQELARPRVQVVTPAAEGPPGLSWLGRWVHRWRTRQQLLQLGPEQLKDLGLSRADAVGEGGKPFWRE